MNILRAVQIFSSGIIAALKLKYLTKYDSTGLANAQATIFYARIFQAPRR
jgi:hypothetical protein